MYEIPVYQLYHSVTGKSSWRGPEHDALYVTILEVVFPTMTMSLTSTTVSFCNQRTMVGHFWKLDPHDPEFNKGSDCSKVCSSTRQIPRISLNFRTMGFCNKRLFPLFDLNFNNGLVILVLWSIGCFWKLVYPEFPHVVSPPVGSNLWPEF